MEVFDPKQPIRKDPPFHSAAGRPTQGVVVDDAVLNANLFDVLGHLAPLQDSVSVSASSAQANPPVPYTQQVVEHVAEASTDRAKVFNLAVAAPPIQQRIVGLLSNSSPRAVSIYTNIYSDSIKCPTRPCQENATAPITDRQHL
jgi:hypothetical protein